MKGMATLKMATWHTLYVKRLKDRGLSKKEALDTLIAGRDEHDYDSDPEDAADDELSYRAEESRGGLERP